MLKKLFKKKPKKFELKDEDRYILWVTKEYEDDGGYASSWYGWVRELTFTHDEAVKLKESLKEKYYSIQIMKHEIPEK